MSTDSDLCNNTASRLVNVIITIGKYYKKNSKYLKIYAIGYKENITSSQTSITYAWKIILAYFLNKLVCK